MIAVVFLGPSLHIAEARELLPTGVFRPPAAQGDLLAAVDRDHAEVIGLIDGTFHQNLSVWHNEVCYLLSRGVTIYGASSMGALRAVETERYGTVGVGCIYRWYRDGVITGDDEVALLHGDEEAHFPSLSEPLVNIRASVDRAVVRGSLDRTFASQLINIAKLLYYPERSVGTILEICECQGFPPDQLLAAKCALTTNYVNLKREDARELLTTISGLLKGSVPRPDPVEFEFARSSVFETLYNLDRKAFIDNKAISMQHIAEHVALHCPDFIDLRRSALDRVVVLAFGVQLGIQVTPEEVLAQRNVFCEKHGLESAAALNQWLHANALSEGDFAQYWIEEAICHRLRNWALTARSMDRGCKALLDELRIRGAFVRWGEEALELDTIVTAYRDQPEYSAISTEHPGLLAEMHAKYGKIHIKGDARTWAEEFGFYNVEDLAEALRRSAIYNDVKDRISQLLKALERAPADSEPGGLGDTPPS